jgi:hypothetical protein
MDPNLADYFGEEPPDVRIIPEHNLSKKWTGRALRHRPRIGVG